MRTKHSNPYLFEMYRQESKEGWSFTLVMIILGICCVLLSGCSDPAWAMNIKLSKHFQQSEFACKCCGETKINIQLVMALEELRQRVNAPIIITSAYRCHLHNKAIGGAKHSQHQYGNAVDIRIKGYTPEQVARLAKDCGFTWTKTYSSWTHIDLRNTKLARER